MKKTIIILLFSAIALTSLQIACSKSEAQTTASTTSTTQIGKVLFTKTGNFEREIWMCNYDGSSSMKINLTLPTGVRFMDDINPRLSPDGKKLFFNAINNNQGVNYYYIDLYVCNIDGTGLTKIVDSSNLAINLGGVY